ncbi:MAG: hypothetical protein ACK5ME_04130 [Parahaliea sp.]
MNPFDKDLASAEQRTSELNSELQRLQLDINWYENTTLNEHQNTCKDLQSDIEAEALVCKNLEIESGQTQIKITRLSKCVNSLWNPKNWFDPEQRSLREEIVTQRQSHDHIKNRHTESLIQIKAIEHQIEAKTDEISRYKNFDCDTVHSKCRDIEKQLSEQKKRTAVLAKKKLQVDTALEPIISQIREIEQKKSNAASAREKAQKLDDNLSYAGNSYERAMAHQTCERLFGTSSPQRAISKKEAEIRRFDRDLEKLYKRAKITIEKAARNIKKLILDGNNLCYEDSTFLGLDTLKVLVPALVKAYDVTVIFDASIRRALSGSDSDIRDMIGSSVKIHVVASGIKADETILDLAGTDSTAFIISNDRFAEFGEKMAVQQKRIIRHEIVSGRIIIHDLGISEVYQK